MSIHIDRNRPRLSLGILWLTFYSVTWSTIHRIDDGPTLLTITILELGIALGISALFSVSLRSRRPLTALLQNDVRSFATAVVGAFVGVLLLAWLEITLTGITLVVASSLAKVELRIAGIRTWRAFVLTGAVSCIAVLCAAATRWGWLQFSMPSITFTTSVLGDLRACC